MLKSLPKINLIFFESHFWNQNSTFSIIFIISTYCMLGKIKNRFKKNIHFLII